MPSILISGAGPTGLVLAIWLTKAGIPVRIIDVADRPGTTSRATVVHARTLELYHQLGIDEAAIRRGIKLKEGNLWVKGKKATGIPLGNEGSNLTPFPFILVLPQDLHEELLTEELSKLGVAVERSTSLIGFEETAGGIIAQINKPDGSTEAFPAAYLAGCDGAHSLVRHVLGIEFPGGMYDNMFYVADLRMSGPLDNGQLNAAVDDADFLLLFPMQGKGRARLIGAIKEEAKDKKDLQWSDVSEDILRRMKLDVKEVFWFSTYHVHHRVAAYFRKGRAFLLGDAGHVHSPVGGQGMNTGIGDAINLAWKLEAILKDGAPDALLDTYESERIAFARKLVASTDRIFTFVDKRSALAAFIRTRIVPSLLSIAFRIDAVRKTVFRTISQTKIHYRQSSLSKGRAGRIQGGDRLPWMPWDDTTKGMKDNFAPLSMRCWQVHCYGTPSAKLEQLCTEKGIPLFSFLFNEATVRAGLRKDAAYLIRPDGYVGLALANDNIKMLDGYIEQWSLGRKHK